MPAVVADRAFNTRQTTNATMGFEAVQSVDYDPRYVLVAARCDFARSCAYGGCPGGNRLAVQPSGLKPCNVYFTTLCAGCLRHGMLHSLLGKLSGMAEDCQCQQRMIYVFVAGSRQTAKQWSWPESVPTCARCRRGATSFTLTASEAAVGPAPRGAPIT